MKKSYLSGAVCAFLATISVTASASIAAENTTADTVIASVLLQPSAVPVPGAVWLLGAGMLVLAAVLRRQPAQSKRTGVRSEA